MKMTKNSAFVRDRLRLLRGLGTHESLSSGISDSSGRNKVWNFTSSLFILTHSVVLPNYQEDETMLRETLENRGRALSTEKHKRIVLAMKAPRVRTCKFLEDAHFSCAWMGPGGSH